MAHVLTTAIAAAREALRAYPLGMGIYAEPAIWMARGVAPMVRSRAAQLHVYVEMAEATVAGDTDALCPPFGTPDGPFPDGLDLLRNATAAWIQCGVAEGQRH